MSSMQKSMGKVKKERGSDKSQKQPKKQGRIGRLDEQTLGYYRRVSDSISGEFENEEDRDLFIDNVFNQMCTEAIKISQNQTVSHIVEMLLQKATHSQLTKFLNAFSKNWETACTDRFACYVTQTLLTKAGRYLNEELNAKLHAEMVQAARNEEGLETETTDKISDLKTIPELVSEFCDYMLYELGFFIQHTYASHILRTLLEVLSGTKVSEKVIRSRVSRDSIKGKHSEEKSAEREAPQPDNKFMTVLMSLCDKITGFPMLIDHCKSSLSNPVLQTLLLVLHRREPDRCAKFCSTVVKDTAMFCRQREKGADKFGLPELVCHEVASHLAEQIIGVASKDLFCELLDEHVRGFVLPYAVHPVANFVLQRIITSCHSKEQFEQLYLELSHHLEDILAVNHMGVVVKVAEGCLKWGTKQEKFVKAVMKAFHCYKPVERQSKIVGLVASLTTYDVFYKVKESGSEDQTDSDDQEDSKEISLPLLKEVNLHGSILLQRMLHFGNPKLLVSSLLDMRPTELSTMACSPCGSHILDSFINSDTIGEKSHDALFNKLKGLYIDIACSKNGSRTIDTLWQAATLKQKHFLAEELAKQEAKLKSDKFGHFVYHNCALYHFIYRRSDWKEIQSGHAKKRKLFQDIIGDQKSTKQGSPKKKVAAAGNESDDDDNHQGLEDSDAGQAQTCTQKTEQGQAATNSEHGVPNKKRKHKHVKQDDPRSEPDNSANMNTKDEPPGKKQKAKHQKKKHKHADRS